MILVLHAIMAAGASTMANACLIDQGQRRSGAAINFNTECVFGTWDVWDMGHPVVTLGGIIFNYIVIT